MTELKSFIGKINNTEQIDNMKWKTFGTLSFHESAEFDTCFAQIFENTEHSSGWIDKYGKKFNTLLTTALNCTFKAT